MPTRAFARAWDRLVDRYERGVEEYVVDVAETFISRAVPRTPRDTGRAQNNWRSRLNISPPRTQIENFDSAAVVVARSVRIYNQYKLGDTIRILNSAEYFRFLNAGRSNQAPADFVAKAVQESMSVVARRRRGRIFSRRRGAREAVRVIRVG